MPFRKKTTSEKIKKANVALNETSKAILPDGKEVTREEILKQLNLDPTVPVDAWLNIAACGSNATALKAEDANTLLNENVIKNDMLLKNQLDEIKKIR